jgi:hypothetical protein
MIGLFYLFSMFFPSFDPGPEPQGHGHSHGPVAEQQEPQQPASSPNSVIHDNIDSQ